MKEAIADLWTFSAQYRCITTNGVVNPNTHLLVMGAGVALEAKKRFPRLPLKLGLWVEKYGNRPFLCKEEKLITLPTKSKWQQISYMPLIMASVQKLVEIVNKFEIESVALPRPGCGNGGLDWEFVRSQIEHVLDDRFTVVYK